MFPTLDLKLNTGIVGPLVELLRAQVAAVEGNTESAGQIGLQTDAGQERDARAEMHTLLELFSPDFANTGLVTIDKRDAPAVLRACSYLRLGLRHEKLCAISNAALETNARPEHYTGEMQRALQCFCFLTTLQMVLIERRFTSAPVPLPRWLQRVQEYFAPLRTDYVEPPNWTINTEVPRADQSWHVVVYNYPVNLMAYVTIVLQAVLGLRAEIAQQHMREVHEAKQSIVWRGPCHKARDHARALRK